MVWVFNASPLPLYPGKEPGTDFTGGWVGTPKLVRGRALKIKSSLLNRASNPEQYST
jgi:hypothetical protein